MFLTRCRRCAHGNWRREQRNLRCGRRNDLPIFGFERFNDLAIGVDCLVSADQGSPRLIDVWFAHPNLEQCIYAIAQRFICGLKQESPNVFVIARRWRRFVGANRTHD